MYKYKSEIIEQIQSYHEQVSQFYFELFEKIEDQNLKLLVHDLYKHEKSREEFLARHKKVAKAMDCWLDFPCDRLSNQISDCLKNMHTDTEMTVEELIKVEMYFDDCLIKLYNILASENELSETVANVFYYMLKKTKKERLRFAEMLYHSKSRLSYKFSA